MQIQISWLLQKPTDLDLYCLQRQGISGFSRTGVKKANSTVRFREKVSPCQYFDSEWIHYKRRVLPSLDQEKKIRNGDCAKKKKKKKKKKMLRI